jgi:hypothetical protein
VPKKPGHSFGIGVRKADVRFQDDLDVGPSPIEIRFGACHRRPPCHITSVGRSPARILDPISAPSNNS